MGTWVHWVAWNVPENHLPHALAKDHALAGGMRQGTNSWLRTGYGGPCPPSGTHRYFFKVYALDTRLELSEQTDRDALFDAMQDHELAKGELVGRYTRD